MTAFFSFASSVTLTTPVPHPAAMSNGVFAHDFAVSTGTTDNWGASGNGPRAPDVLFGSACISAFDDLTGSTHQAPITFALASDMVTEGASVAGVAGGSVTLKAYDALGSLLKCATVPAQSGP